MDVDSTTQKTAVSVLSKMVVGGGDEVMERVVSTLLSLPLTPHFSFKDAASQLVRILSLNYSHRALGSHNQYKKMSDFCNSATFTIHSDSIE